MMPKYKVRFENKTYAENIIEAEDEDKAVKIMEDMYLDRQYINNMKDLDTIVEEIE
jgi:hypothetical protein